MAQFRPFAIKTGENTPNPSGTVQNQNIWIGTAQQNYNNIEGDWVAGPDEELGHIIAFHDADGDTFRGARIGITNCFIGFLRSKLLTDGSFLELGVCCIEFCCLETFWEKGTGGGGKEFGFGGVGGVRV